jgi:hypothetical protein
MCPCEQTNSRFLQAQAHSILAADEAGLLLAELSAATKSNARLNLVRSSGSSFFLFRQVLGPTRCQLIIVALPDLTAILPAVQSLGVSPFECSRSVSQEQGLVGGSASASSFFIVLQVILQFQDGLSRRLRILNVSALIPDVAR